MNSLLQVFVGVKIFGDKQMMQNHLYCHWEMRIEAQDYHADAVDKQSILHPS